MIFGGTEDPNTNSDGGEISCASARHRRRNAAVAIGSNTAPAMLRQSARVATVEDAVDAAGSIIESMTTIDVVRFLPRRNGSKRTDGEKHERNNQHKFVKAGVCDKRRDPDEIWNHLSSRNRCVIVNHNLVLFTVHSYLANDKH